MNNSSRTLRCDVMFRRKLVDVPATAQSLDQLHTARHLLHAEYFWLEFWAGNNGDTFASNPAWAHPASNPVEMQKFEAEGETEHLAHKQTIAVSFVRHHPLLFADVSLRRAVRFWTGCT